jgi:hypothetical protein
MRSLVRTQSKWDRLNQEQAFDARFAEWREKKATAAAAAAAAPRGQALRSSAAGIEGSVLASMMTNARQGGQVDSPPDGAGRRGATISAQSSPVRVASAEELTQVRKEYEDKVKEDILTRPQGSPPAPLWIYPPCKITG